MGGQPVGLPAVSSRQSAVNRIGRLVGSGHATLSLLHDPGPHSCGLCTVVLDWSNHDVYCGRPNDFNYLATGRVDHHTSPGRHT